VWPTLLTYLFPEYVSSYFPTFIDQIPGVVAFWLLIHISSQPLIIFGFAWIIWYFVGTLNVVSSALFYGQYYSNLPIGDAAFIYLNGCLFFVIGLLIFERLPHNLYSPTNCRQSRPRTLGLVTNKLILAFPFIWLVAMIIKLGYIPMLSGVDITDDIYELDYGFVYQYTAVIALSALFCLDQLLQKKLSGYWWFYLIVVVFISFADGKRVVAMIIAGGAVPLFFLHLGSRSWKKIGLFILVFIALYIFIQIARVGWQNDQYGVDSITKYMAVGVEYRDFVFSVNYLTPGNVPGYSWLSSSVASMINDALLSIFSLEKAALVREGSAYAWSDVFGSPFGIRTGIVSELWFAYGFFYFIPLISIGIITGFVLYFTTVTQGENGRLFFVGVSGLLLLSIVGQSTGIFGTITVYFYVFIVGWVESMIVGKRQQILSNSGRN
jgi:hypothetical protein